MDFRGITYSKLGRINTQATQRSSDQGQRC